MPYQIAKQQQQLIQQQHKINVLQQQIQVTVAGAGRGRQSHWERGLRNKLPPRLDEEAILCLQFPLILESCF